MQELFINYNQRPFSLKLVALACLALCYSSANALGLGDATLQSGLGQGLRVQIPVNGVSDTNSLVPNCIKTRVVTIDGEMLATPRVDIVVSPQSEQTVFLNLSTKQSMLEPAIKVSVTMACGITLQREYTLLLDYATSVEAPTDTTSVQAGITQPVTSVTPLPVPAMQEAPVAAGKSKPLTTPSKVHRTKHGSSLTPTLSFNPSVNQPQQQGNNAPADFTPEPVKKHAHATNPPNSVGHDVLKMSSQDAVTDFDLKMSQALKEQAEQPLTPADQQRQIENRLAQARFAAMLRGEDSDVIAQNNKKSDQQKITQLEKEIEQIKQQNKVAELEQQSVPNFVIGLIVLAGGLFVALLGMVWLNLRNAAEKRANVWWDPSADLKKNVTEIVDQLQSSAEQGKLDPNTIIEQPGVTPPSEIKIVNDAIEYPHTKEGPNPKYKRSGLPALEDTNSSTFNFFVHRGHSIQIEEVSDLTQEAEFWMSVNDPNRAIEILEPESHDDNPAMPITWLYLLDLYRMVGDEEKYRELRRRFKRKFNASIPNFDEVIDVSTMRYLEDFEHLLAKCCALWKTDQILPFLESLLVDDREGERVGFDLPVYRDILFLISICNEIQRTKKILAPPMEPILNRETAKEISVPEVVKPTEEEAEYPNSLNFDMLDFKADKK